VLAACLAGCLSTGPAAAQRKALGIAHPVLLDADGGFPSPPGTVYQSGETMYLSFNIEGFEKDRSDRIKLSYTVDSLDFNGVPFVPREQGKVDTELAPQDAKWLPRVQFSATLPPFADSGTFKFVMHVTDQLANKQASAELPFPVRGRVVEPSDALVIRNFRFARQEDGEPLPVAAYRRGDVLWASFDITGYKTGEKNNLQVEYDLSVFNPENKLIFKQPEPAEEKGTSFYPRRYVHAAFNLNLESNIAPGQYAIQLTVRDSLGNQTSETRQTFTVE
jgi:hypothetical protein